MAKPLLWEIELVADDAGQLSLPEDLLTDLELAEGDLLAFEPGPLSLRIDLYRDFLADNWMALGPAVRSAFLMSFLRRPQGAVGPAGTLALPAGIVTPASGERLLLQVVPRGLSHVLYLYRTAPTARLHEASAISVSP
jgi:hypothetical protein